MVIVWFCKSVVNWFNIKLIIWDWVLVFVNLLLYILIVLFINVLRFSGSDSLVIICKMFIVVWWSVNGFLLFLGNWLILKIFIRVFSLLVSVIDVLMFELGSVLLVKCGMYCLYSVFVIGVFLLLFSV